MILRSGVHSRNLKDRGKRGSTSVEQRLESLCEHGFYTPSIKVPMVTVDPDGSTVVRWITKAGSGKCPH